MAYRDIERKRAAKRAYDSTHRAEKKASAATYYLANREKMSVRQAAYRLANRDKRRAYNAAYRAAHPEKDKARYVQDRDRILAVVARWQSENRDRRAHYGARRRALQRSNGGSHTVGEWRDKRELFANLCAYCGEARPLSRDHKVPLSRGGTDDITNILPACKSCNSRKGTRTLAEFLAAA